jgi:hypothetical protein
MRRLILRNFQSPGDIVMLTAAVCDLHLTYPQQFVTACEHLSGSFGNISPYLTPIEENEPYVQIIEVRSTRPSTRAMTRRFTLFTASSMT